MPEQSGTTIYAPATGQMRSAVGIMRLSGPHVLAVAERLAGCRPLPRHAMLRSLRDPDTAETIDRALLLYFPGPTSFTGEDVLEIQHHGGHAVTRMLLSALATMPGLAPAEPGAFTRRAFLNGKLDLTQAEALADLIDATSAAQARAALRQLDGALGRLYASWRRQLLQALAMLEAEIDFAAEEEVPDDLWSRLHADITALGQAIRNHLDDRGRGERLRAGLTIAVIGAPNVGKSSLVNALARRDVAIVTPVPGTTRDIIEVALDLDGLPVTLLDTAGLRESDDPIEKEGIERARRRAALADLRLRLIDDPGDLMGPAMVDGPTLSVLNKSDLWPAWTPPEGCLAISVHGNKGLDQLLDALIAQAKLLLPDEDAVFMTRSRHRVALEEALSALQRALALGERADLGLQAEEIRLAARAIGRITGAVGVEEILDQVFATFCIGK